MLFLWHPDDKADMKTIDNETNIIDDDEEWKTIKKKLKEFKIRSSLFKIRASSWI